MRLIFLGIFESRSDFFRRVGAEAGKCVVAQWRMTALKLDSLHALPDALKARLLERRSVFEASPDLDDALSDPVVRTIDSELERHLRTQQVVAYHCTREPEPGYFQQQGLHTLSLKGHQAWFLDTYGHQFTPEERTRMESAWAGYFVGKQATERQGTLWFCLTTNTVRFGTDAFFKYCGGEAINKPLQSDPEILTKLQSIGRPVVVECSVAGADFAQFQHIARPLLHSFHRTIRHDAIDRHLEGRIHGSIAPCDVLTVHPASTFGMGDK